MGRARAERDLIGRGVDEPTAAAAVGRHYEGRDDALLSEALEQILRAMGGVRSRRELARIARRLIARGFDPESVAERLRKAGLTDE